jgi:hypothetical protein
MNIPTWSNILRKFTADYKELLDEIDKQISTLYQSRITDYINKYYISIIESKIFSIEIYKQYKQFRQYLLESIKTLLIANGYNIIKYEFYENYNKQEHSFIQFCFYYIL